MTGSPQQLVNGLHWMLPQLEACIARARNTLEQHLEGPADLHSLKSAEAEFRLVAGAVGMIHCFGASLLAREMADLTEALIAEKVERVDDAFSTLSGASLQLSDYLDLVGRCAVDRVLVLQPTLNELRLTRGQPVFTESDLVALQLAELGLPPAAIQSLDKRRRISSGQDIAKRELSNIQIDFLKFFHGKQPAVALKRIARGAALLATSCSDAELREYWTAAAALAESLPEAAFDSLEVKRLLGRSIVLLKRLAESGESGAGEKIRLRTYHLLVQIGRCPVPSPRARALSAWYQLPLYLPDAATIDAMRDRLRGPNTAILSRVFEELEGDLAQIKDSIDLYQRGRGRQGASLQVTRERLSRVGGTLQMLGLPAMDAILRREVARIETLEADGGDWMPTATALLRVEHTLKDGLFRAIGRTPAVAADGSVKPEKSLEDTDPPLEQDLRQAVQALIREAHIEFAVLKAAVETYLTSADESELGRVPGSLHLIASGLTLIECHRGAGLVYRLEAYARSGNLERLNDPAEAARFADAVAAAEYYLEAVSDELPDTERILIDMVHFLDELEPSFDVSDSEVLFTAAQPLESTDVDEPAMAAEPVAAVAEAAVIDPEIREIFIEEAREVLEQLRGRMRALEGDPKNSELLADLRRGFHTLKGSGRMVGATQIGEFSWAIENLLNRCLNGALLLRPPIIDLVKRAIDMLPSLIEQFADPAQSPGEPEALIARAGELLEGDEEPSADIYAIFREDSRERIATLRAWLEEQDPSQDGFPVTDEVIRAFHTLRGSASIIKSVPIGTLASSLEGFLKAVRLSGRLLPLSALSLIADSVVALGGWIDGWGEAKVADGAVAGWLARVEAAKKELASDHGQHAEDAQRYAMAAFDEIGRAEQQLREALEAGASIPAEAVGTLNRLTVSAAEIGDGAVARVALQLGKHLGDAPAELDSAYQAVVFDAFDGLYQCLDHFRDGTAAEIDSLLSRLVALPLGSESEGAEERGLVEVFREEARGLLMDVDDAVRSAHAAPNNASEALVSLRMSFHTLKGSARMVGLLAVGDAASELEKRVLDIRTDAGLPAELARLMGEIEAFRGILGEVRAGPPPIEPAAHLVAEPELDAPWIIDQAELGIEPPATEAALPEWPSDAAVDLMALAEPGPVSVAATLDEEISWQAGDIADRTTDAPHESVLDLDAALSRLNIDSGSEPSTDGQGSFDSSDSGFWATENRPVEAADFASSTSENGSPAGADLIDEGFFASHAPDARTEDQNPVIWGDAGYDAELAGDPIVIAQGPMDEAEVTAGIGAAVVSSSVIEFKSAKFLVSEGKAMMESEAEPIDEELREVFFGEAAELLDVLDAMLESWQNGDENYAVREVQRALHTLKGGARMAGLPAMGDAAHDFETLVDQVVAHPTREGDVFGTLRRRLEALQSMHDRMSAGRAIVVEAAVPPLPESQDAAGLSETAEPVQTQWDPALFWQPDDELIGVGLPRREMARVPVEALDSMLNESGEVSIFCARLEQQNILLQAQLGEITQTIGRVREQLRMLDIETDAQIAARGLNATAEETDQYAQDFDPLEMDRYSRMQELSRTLAESINDLAVLRTSMEDMLGENDTLLGQQRRSTSQLQQGLMRTLMVPFSRQAPRLQRLVRQAAEETQKQVELRIDGVDAELDRNVLERMIAPLEHLIRNAIIHGIESPELRAQRDKPPAGDLHIRLQREGTQLLLELADDGNGLDYGAIRRKAVQVGLMPEHAQLSDTEVGHFIFEPGFSTAGALTQSAGRGIGMDIVLSEVKQLGGTLELTSEPECGTRFLMRLPLTLAVNQALLVSVGSESFAIPLSSVDGIARVPRTGNDAWLADDAPPVAYGDQNYKISYLSDLIGFPRVLPVDVRTLTAVLIHIGEGVGTTERHVAVVVDRLVGNREMVSKPIGPQVSPVPGIAGGTILPDGKVVMILDVPALYAERARRAALQIRLPIQEPDVDRRKTVLVVDDSVTMRRIAERLLTRSGYKVSTAKDGLDAMAHMQTERPDLIMLDIEMPRADGFEVATFIRNSPRLADLPVIMITSRSGEKHRERARSLGVDRYMIKPYQEDELLSEVGDLLKMESVDGR